MYNAKLKFMFSSRPQNSWNLLQLIWHYVVDVKSTMKILSILVAFLEHMNFNGLIFF